MPDFVGRSGPGYRAALLVRSGKAPARGLSRRPISRPGASRPSRSTWLTRSRLSRTPGWRSSAPKSRSDRFVPVWLISAGRKPAASRRRSPRPGRPLVCCSRVEAHLFGDGHEAAACEQAGSGVLAEAVDPRTAATCPRTYGLLVCLQILALPACSQASDQQCLCPQTSRFACHLRKSSNAAILFPADSASGLLHAVKITVRSSVNVSIGYRPPTRPMPLAVPAPPPNGRWLSQWLVVTLMLTMPLRTFSA
jgi:hypothetical protein